ncbi:MAG TPA: FprA family A-type flavoprotein [Deltaproteobacteria bacterium]|nr:FprA family A-type flavoprotein [Deltaproteobacteria bacterium]HPR55338.1 FprA family A-type flavoprotein [Deltaproteobacteria bacterium]HXK47464.1 FprA family A-type flavoprotein [Deltaproteobacteria bacterium]
MHLPIEITRGVFWVGVNDRESDLFEAMWPLPKGISYNAYLITGTKTALIDTVKKTHFVEHLDKITRILGPDRSIDYLVINHIEPDHSGSLEALTRLFPHMKIIGNKRTLDLLDAFYGTGRNAMAVNDRDTLDLGERTLSFHITPMVHWPETMMTYDPLSATLFSGDAFGAFGTVDGALFDNETGQGVYEDEILRYYSNIIGKFSPMVTKAIEKVGGLTIGTLATAHGLVWRDNPGYVVGLYDRWSRHEAEKGVVLAYASMYGNTLKMAEETARGLAEAGLKDIVMHDVSHSHPSYVIRDAWRYQGIILGSCTYEMSLFPPMRHLTDLLVEKALKKRLLGIFGTYGWTGGAVKGLREFAQKIAWEIIEPVIEVKCSARSDELDQCRLIGNTMASRILSRQSV